MKHYTSILLIIFLSSCSSMYKSSDNMIKMSSTMNYKEALSVFHEAIDENKKEINVCDLNIISDDKVIPTDYGFKIKAYKKGEKVGERSTGSSYEYIYKKKYYTKKVHVKNVYRVDIQERKNAIYPCRPDKKGDYEVIISYSTTGRIMFGVNSVARDKFLAALTILAPNAKLKTGMGFWLLTYLIS